MKKETINTFQKGMIKDLHPLTTPNDVLTDALNATSITYNGNEGALQNDMGNVKIKNALLKAGYVPVGMKEHGGIIYVAAYNPETGKGQVGSFPSPKQLWESENWSVNAPAQIISAPTIRGSIYKGNFIKNEIVRQAIFTTQEGPRIFHPGDKFIVSFPYKTKELKDAISAGYVDIQLGVVKSDGGIEIMRTWSKDNNDSSFLFDTTIPENPFSNKNNVQVFDASSSGEMLFIINLHTLDSFNVLRSYSMNDDKKIVVTCTGEGRKDNETYNSTTEDSYLKLATDESNYDLSAVTLTEEASNKGKIDIYPVVPFGIVERMKRPINVNFDKIRKNQDDFGEWRFFVTEDYLKIGWAYDFYNLDGTKEIEYIKMYFYKLEDGPNGDPKEITFQRESYNGNFEDYIDYKQLGLAYKNIYIVKIVKKITGEGEQVITYKMLYLSKLYNSYYNGFYDTKNMIGGGQMEEIDRSTLEYKPAEVNPVTVKVNLKSDISLKESNATVITPDETKYEVPTSNIKPSMYTTLSEGLNLEEEHTYLTTVINKYKTNLKLEGELQGLESEIIGIPNPTIIDSVLNNYRVSVYEPQINNTFVSSTTLKDFPPIQDVPAIKNFEGDLGNQQEGHTFPEFVFGDYRRIQGISSDEQSKSYNHTGLQPLYNGKLTGERRKHIAPYCDITSANCLCGDFDDDKTVYYNSTLTKAGEVIKGADAGGGYDDGGLKTASRLMGSPLTNIFTGINGDQAEIEFRGLRKQENTKVSLNMTDDDEDVGGEVIMDQSDNYLIACWKFTDGDIRFVNLITRRDAPTDGSVDWPRLDIMMRCILSQIFIVNRTTSTAKYITTDERFYRYEEGQTTLPIQLQYYSNNQSNLNDIMISEVSGESLTDCLIYKWGYKNGNLFNGTNEAVPFTNLIPKVNVTTPSNENITIEVPNFYDLDVLLPNYFGVEYRPVDNEQYDAQKIYGLDVDKVTENAAAQGKDLTYPKANPDGAFEWKTQPACVELSSTLKMYRWSNNSTNSKVIEFPEFVTHFITKAAMEQWNEVPEGEFNEIYGVTDSLFAVGSGTNGNEEDAPDMYYETLYSPEISLLNNHLR